MGFKSYKDYVKNKQVDEKNEEEKKRQRMR